MDYQDDILNVYAFLREKTSQNLSRTLAVAMKQDSSRRHLDELTSEISMLEDQLRQLATLYDLDVSVPPETIEQKEKTQDKNALTTDYPKAKLKIHIDPDYDFKKAFNELVQEAEAASFKNTCPEDLLSFEDMKRAEERSRLIDERFSEQTGLRKKDIVVLIIVSSIKIALYYFEKYGLTFKKKIKEAKDKIPKNDDSHTIVDSVQEVGLNSFSDLLYSLDGAVAKFRGEKPVIPHILDRNTILNEPVPFNVSDNSEFSHTDILGFDPIMGWLFGTLNFLTRTVTTINLDSYAVKPTINGEIGIEKKVSTLIDVFFPVINELDNNKESIVTAIVREADVLNVPHASYEIVSTLLSNEFREKEHLKDIISNGYSLISPNITNNIDVLKKTSLTAFIDILGSAIFSVMYDPSTDGEIQLYSLRMHKSLLMSNAFASLANSIPAIVSEDPSSIDFSSILYTLLCLFHSTKYWSEIKTKYLVSEHKKIIDMQLQDINKYFDY